MEIFTASILPENIVFSIFSSPKTLFMKPENILKSNILDIIFENKNKAYGAYELRKNYQRRLNKALTVTAFIVLVFSIAQSFKVPKKTTEVKTNLLEGVFLTTVNIPENEQPKEQPKEKIKKENIATAAVAPPIVVPDKLANNNMSDVDKIDTSAIAGTESEGKKVTTEFDIKKGEPTDGAAIKKDEPEIVENKEPEILNFSQVMPEFPGGKEALILFLQKNLRQPDDFSEGEKLTVVASFVVNATGMVDNITITQHGRTDLDNEVVRVIKKMPNWKPGVQNGRNVAVYYKIPVTFVAPD